MQINNPNSIRQARNAAEKQRRDKLNTFINDLANIVPFTPLANKRLDKISILRLSAAYLRLHLKYRFFKFRPEQKIEKKKLDLISKIIETLNGFMLILNNDRKIILVSQNCINYLGHQDIDMIGNSLDTFVHPLEIDMVKNELKQLESDLSKNCKSKTKVIRCRMKTRIQPKSEHSSYQFVQFSGYLVNLDLINKKTTINDKKVNNFNSNSNSNSNSYSNNSLISNLNSNSAINSNNNLNCNSNCESNCDSYCNLNFNTNCVLNHDLNRNFNSNINSDINSNLNSNSNSSFNETNFLFNLSENLTNPNCTNNTLSSDQSINSSKINLSFKNDFMNKLNTNYEKQNVNYVSTNPSTSFLFNEPEKKIKNSTDQKSSNFIQSNLSLLEEKQNFLFVGFVQIIKRAPFEKLTLFESLQNEYTTLFSLNCQLLAADHRISSVTGCLPKEVLNLNAFKFIHKNDHLITKIAYQMMMDSTDGTGKIVHRLKTKNGNHIYIESVARLNFDESRTPQNFFCYSRLLSDSEGEKERAKFVQKFSIQTSYLNQNKVEVPFEYQKIYSLNQNFCIQPKNDLVENQIILKIDKTIDLVNKNDTALRPINNLNQQNQSILIDNNVVNSFNLINSYPIIKFDQNIKTSSISSLGFLILNQQDVNFKCELSLTTQPSQLKLANEQTNCLNQLKNEQVFFENNFCNLNLEQSKPKRQKVGNS